MLPNENADNNNTTADQAGRNSNSLNRASAISGTQVKSINVRGNDSFTDIMQASEVKGQKQTTNENHNKSCIPFVKLKAPVSKNCFVPKDSKIVK